MVHHAVWGLPTFLSLTSRPPTLRLTDHSEVDLSLSAAQLVLHQQCVAAAVLLACGQDGELAAALAGLHFDVLALLDLRQSGQVLEMWARKGKGLRLPLPIPWGMQLCQLSGFVWTLGLPQGPSLLYPEPSLPGGPDLGLAGRC